MKKYLTLFLFLISSQALALIADGRGHQIAKGGIIHFQHGKDSQSEIYLCTIEKGIKSVTISEGSADNKIEGNPHILLINNLNSISISNKDNIQSISCTDNLDDSSSYDHSLAGSMSNIYYVLPGQTLALRPTVTHYNSSNAVYLDCNFYADNYPDEMGQYSFYFNTESFLECYNQPPPSNPTHIEYYENSGSVDVYNKDIDKFFGIQRCSSPKNTKSERYKLNLTNLGLHGHFIICKPRR